MASLDRIIHSTSVRRIQRWYRSKKTRDPVCPISFEPLSSVRIYRFYPASGGRPIGYNIAALLSYIETTGRDIDPMTRTRYTLRDMRRFDAVINYYKLGAQSPLHTRELKMSGIESELRRYVDVLRYPGESDMIQSFVMHAIQQHVVQTTLPSLKELSLLHYERSMSVFDEIIAGLSDDRVEENYEGYLCAMARTIARELPILFANLKEASQDIHAEDEEKNNN